MVERWHHKPGVVGSSPTLGTKNGGVAQLARALACRAKGYEFEPRRPRLRLAEVLVKASFYFELWINET